MSTRQEQYREAQRRRRERLKESGVKAITIELSAAAHAKLKALSSEMFGDESQPSRVVEALLTSSSTKPVADDGMTASTAQEPPKPKTDEDIRPRSRMEAHLLRHNALLAEWQHWPGVLGIDPTAWYSAKSNAVRKELAKKALRPIWSKYHPDRGGDPDVMAAYQAAYESVSIGKKSPDMPKRWAGWGVLREI